MRDIEKRRLKRDFEKPPLKDVTHIAIDEIAIRKGHKYLTVVMDLHTGRVIFVGDYTVVPLPNRTTGNGCTRIESLFHLFESGNAGNAYLLDCN